MIKQLQSIESKIEQINILKTEIQKAIKDLPDNPNIKRTGEKSFIISSSQIFGNADNPHSRMDVFYHDFKAQYKKIAEVITTVKPENVTVLIEVLVLTGRINRGHNKYHSFHPTVIEHIRKLTMNEKAWKYALKQARADKKWAKNHKYANRPSEWKDASSASIQMLRDRLSQPVELLAKKKYYNLKHRGTTLENGSPIDPDSKREWEKVTGNTINP